MNEKDTSVIPKGPYCYTYIDGKRIICPYWEQRKEYHYQECGYCSFLGYGDWEINEKEELIGDYPEDIKGERGTGHQLGIPVGLLWDMCKECSINEEEE